MDANKKIEEILKAQDELKIAKQIIIDTIQLGETIQRQNHVSKADRDYIEQTIKELHIMFENLRMQTIKKIEQIRHN